MGACYNFSMAGAMKTILLLILFSLLAACAPGSQTAEGQASGPTRTPADTPAELFPIIDQNQTPLAPGDAASVLEIEKRVAAIAQSYVADTPEAAVREANSMDFAQGKGDPSSMCGPLAISILRDAGMINRYVSLQAFWLWRPRTNPRLAEITFPEDQYQHYVFSQALNEFDFRSFPLQAGDFLYLYAGSSGTFEHMLVVDRVDEAGRAYSVTNLKTESGFVVREVLLYDPQAPGTGQFYEWTSRQNLKLGRTGSGGFEVWRLVSPPPAPSPAQVNLAQGIDQVLAQTGGSWHILIKQIDGPVIYSRAADDRLMIAAAVKIPIALLFFKSMDMSSIPADHYSAYLGSHGLGRTYDQLLEAMLIHSENEATALLLQQSRWNQPDVSITLDGWGARLTDVDSRFSTVTELANLMEGLYSGNYILPEGRAYILNLMGQYTSSADHLSTLRRVLTAWSEFYDFRGSTLDDQRAVGDYAMLTLPSQTGKQGYIIVVFGDLTREPQANADLEQVVQQIARFFWSYVNSYP